MSGRGARPGWERLPDGLRAAVEAVLDDEVVDARSMPGGWSPGSADRVVLRGGGRAFVKAASAEVDAGTVALHRREAQVLALLQGSGAAPALLGVAEHGPWVALATEDVGGRHPDPTSDADVAAVLDAVAALPEAPAGAPLRRIEDELADDALGWERLRADGAELPSPVTAALPGLAALAAGMPGALRGGSVVHLDLRVDNALVDDEGRGRLVDWPSAVCGARWVDAVTLLLDVRHLGGAVEAGLAHPVLRDVPPEHVDVLLAVLGAYFFDSARRPEPPALPGLRGFQRAQGVTALAWLLERRPGLR